MKQHVSYSQSNDGTEFNRTYNTLERVIPKKHRIGEAAREYVHSYLSTHPCAICGESDPRVLEFHPAGDKGWILSSIVGGGNALIGLQAEIAKCTVLCTNCRKKISNHESGWFTGRR